MERAYLIKINKKIIERPQHLWMRVSLGIHSNDIKEVIDGKEYDVICFFTPSGVKSLFDNLPGFKQNGTVIGAFGNNTSKAVEDAGLKLEIKVPSPQKPSMVSALDQFLASTVSKK